MSVAAAKELYIIFVMNSAAQDLVTDALFRLREWVLDGTLQMGERLNVVKLAEILQSSRTPVREALSRLTSEGFATFVPNRGHFVVVYTAERVAEIYGCRAVLESEAARLAARAGLPASDRIEMERIIDEIDAKLVNAAADEGRLLKLVALNNRFHEMIYARCDNAELRRLIHQTTTIPRSIRNYFRFSERELQESNRVHRLILRAVADGEGDRAAAAMREHIWAARDRMLPRDEVERRIKLVQQTNYGHQRHLTFHPLTNQGSCS